MRRQLTSIRLHPDLLEQAQALGAPLGLNTSQLVEWALGEMLNLPYADPNLPGRSLEMCPNCTRGVVFNDRCGACRWRRPKQAVQQNSRARDKRPEG